MAEQWIIRVLGKEYGPADVATLGEWKNEGRVLPTNEARRMDDGGWTVAAEIPGLFELPAAAPPPPVQTSALADADDRPVATEHSQSQRSLREILIATLSIFRRGFFGFLGLTLLVIGPSICAQATEAWIKSAPGTNVDLATAAAYAFGLCMTFLTVLLWPVYVAGIQILSAELSGQHRVGFLGVLNAAIKFWPRVASLSLVVYGIFFLLFIFALGIMLVAAVGGPSLPVAMLVLLLLFIQMGLFSRWFIHTLFWQQTAVLEKRDPIEALQLSKEVARSRSDLVWYRRPLWRAVFIASIWVAFDLAIGIAAAWPALQEYLRHMPAAPDMNSVMEAMKAAEKTSAQFDVGAALLSLLKWIVRPLLGIAFVLLYLDSRPNESRKAP